ncbi:MAG: digeranylgeranylglycerophospholipid reductase [Halobacteriales archaeon]
MAERYDVAVAGAGPAGAQTARDLAARDYDVVVLETEPEDDFPRQSNKSTGGTFPSMMAAFDVPDEVVMQFTDSVVIESPNDHFAQHQPGAVLDFAAFKRFLVEAGREKGAEYRFDARATAPITDSGQAVGIRYDGDEEVYADVVVDATGPAAPLAKEMGVTDLQRNNQAIGVEYEFEGVELDADGYADLNDAMMLRLDHDIAPGGYSWIFHTGEDTAKVGVCYIQNDIHGERARDGFTIDDYLEYWIDGDPRFADAERIEGRQHRGSAHIQKPGDLYTDGFMAVGDTVPTVDPLWGEGINKGMQSGRAAAITADRALIPTDPDVSAESLSVYGDLWHERVAPTVNSRLLMTHLLYMADNDRYDRLMRDLRSTPTDTLAKANAGNRWAMLKLLHLADVSMLPKVYRHLGDL